MMLLDIITAVGLAAILAAFIYIGRKLQVLDDLQRTTNKIKLNVKVMSDYLTTSGENFNHTELQTYSPIKLTKKGHQLIKEVGFDTVFEDHKASFFALIDTENPKLKYDVERAAIASVLTTSSENYMNFLKVYFYNNPGRNISNVSPTLGVYIRDKYLQAHPEITE